MEDIRTVCWCLQAGSPAEERQRGSVKKILYLTYLRAWGPALIVPAVFLFLSFASEGFGVRFFLTLLYVGVLVERSYSSRYSFDVAETLVADREAGSAMVHACLCS